VESLIEVRDLRFQFPDGTEALRGIDFRMMRGECVILFGPNGSGKTTFALHLNGLLRGKGDIRICGMPMETKNLAAIRRKVGLVFQDPDEQLFMPTVLEDVAFGLLNQGMPVEQARKAALRELELVGMAHAAARAPYHLSCGEKRRVALAGVLAMQPEILVLDEPTTSLDPPAQRDLVDLLLELPQVKIVTTHDGHFARAIGTRAVFFREGRVAGEGGVEEVLRRFNWESYATAREPGAGGFARRS